MRRDKRKRIIALLLVMVSIFSILPENIAQAFSSELVETSDGFVVEKDTGTLKEYKGSLKDLKVPNEILGIKIKNITIYEELDSITIGQYVEKMSANKMKNIYVDINNPYFTTVDGVLYNKYVTEIVAYPCLRNESEYTIAESTRKIGEQAFLCCNLTTINIPESVTEIGFKAFWGSLKLKEVVLPENLQEIGAIAFNTCSNLEKCILPSGLKSLGNGAFSFTNIKEVTIPEGITEIGESTFSECENLEKVNLGSGVKSIGMLAFARCKKLKDINLDENIKEIGYEAFKGAGLEKVEIKFAQKIGAYAFAFMDNLEQIVLGDNIKIDIAAFSYNNNLKTVKMGKNTNISHSMFRKNTLLEEVEIEDGITEIEYSAFENCKSLREINIPNSIKNIKYRSFSGCSNLRKVVLPESVKSIESMAFSYIDSLNSLYIPQGVDFIGSDIFFEGDKNVTIMAQKDSYAHQYAIDNNINFYNIEGNNDNYLIKVIDNQTNSPLGNVKLMYPSGQATTDEKGVAKLNLESNIVSLSIKQEGYSTYNKVEKLIPNAINIVYLRPSKSIINNISYEELTPSNDIVEGPEVDVLGEGFNLFKFQVGLDFSIFKNIQTYNDVEKRKFKILVGFKDIPKDKFQEKYNNMMNLYSAQKSKRPNNVVKRYLNNIEDDVLTNGGKFGIKADFSSIGFIEFNYSTGDMVLSNGGISLIGSAGVSTKYPFGGICYATFALDGDLRTSIKLKKNDDSNSVGINLDEVLLALKPRIAVGAGFESLAYAEAGILGGITGKLKNINSNATIRDNFEAALYAQIYIEVQALGFKTYQAMKYDTTIYPRKRKIQKMNINLDQFSIIERDSNNLDEFSIIERDYVNNVRNGRITSNENYSFIKENVYSNGEPQLIDLDNEEKLLIWIDDNESRTIENKSMLMYSVFKDNKWSEAAAVNDDMTGDFSPRIYKENNKVHVVWQNLSKVVDSNETIEDVAKLTELKYATFENGAFKNITNITFADEVYEGMHSISAENGEVSIIWTENSNNNIFMTNGVNSIYKKTLKDNNLSSKTLIKGDLGRIGELSSGYSNGINLIAYTVDSDNTLSTVDDIELYLAKENDFIKITDNDAIETSLQIINGQIYWIENNSLKVMKNGDINSILVVKDIENISQVQILSHLNDVYIFENITNDFVSDIYMSRYDSALDKWYNDIKITDLNKNIKDFKASINSDNNISMAINTRDIKSVIEDGKIPFENNSLLVINSIDKVDLQVDNEFIHSEDNLDSYNTGKVNLNTNVKNNGTKNVNRVRLELLSDDDKVISSEERDLNLSPGESKKISYTYCLGKIKNRHNIRLKLEPIDEVDINEKDNYSKGTIGLSDLNIDNLYKYKENDLRKIKFTLHNSAIEDAKDVVINVYLGGVDGTKIKEFKFNKLTAGEYTNLEMIIPEDKLNFNNKKLMELITVEVSTSTDERDYFNNRNDIYIEPLSIKNIILDKEIINMKVGGSSKLNATVESSTTYNKEIRYVSSNDEIATVDTEGNIVAKKSGEIQITVISEYCDYTKTCKVNIYDKSDVNMDNNIDILDLSLIALNYNSSKDDGRYTEEHDINNDEIIDLYDLVMVAKKM